jgi:hypothetical protein
MHTPGGMDSRPTGIDSSTSLGPAFWLGTALAALLGAAVGVFFVLPLGLIVVEYVIFPLALFVGAVLASLAAGWAGNRLAPDATRTQLLRVFGVTLAAAVVLAVLLLANSALRLVLLGPAFYVGLISAAVLALAATVAAARFRSAQSASNDVRLTLWLLALAVLSVPAAIFFAWLAGLTGA